MIIKMLRGSKPRLKITLTDPVTKAFVDPTGLSLLIKDPQRGETTYTYLSGATIVRSSLGEYYADIDMSSMNGDWLCRWEASGTGQGAAEVTIRIYSPYDGVI
jgi:hypothetical protein